MSQKKKKKKRKEKKRGTAESQPDIGDRQVRNGELIPGRQRFRKCPQIK